MKLVFYLSYIIWFSSEVIYNLFLHSKNNNKKATDRGSLLLIWIVIILGIFLSVNIRANFSDYIMSWVWLPFIGLAIIWLGVITRLLVVISLGKFFTVNVTIKEDHKLKTDGFYKYLRHPSYTMSLLSFIGFGISLNNWISLALITLATLFAFRYRINVEERALIEQFGEEYVEYKKKTKGLIPFIF